MTYQYQFRCSVVSDSATRWTAASRASLSITNSWSFTQTHAHRLSDAIQTSHPLLSPSPPTFNLSQHQDLFQGVSSSHQVVKVLASASVLLMNIQGWFPLGLTSLISLQFKGLWREFSSTTVRKHQFLGSQCFIYCPCPLSVTDLGRRLLLTESFKVLSCWKLFHLDLDCLEHSLDEMVGEGDEGSSPNCSLCISLEVTLITSVHSPLARISCEGPSIARGSSTSRKKKRNRPWWAEDVPSEVAPETLVE